MLAVCLQLAILCAVQGIQLNVGVILEGSSPEREAAFHKAFQAANYKSARTHCCPPQTVTLNPIVRSIGVGDTFAAATATCELLAEQVVAVFGPDGPSTSTQARLISQKYSIPYLLAQWDVNANEDLLNHSINLHPSSEDVGQALVDFLHVAEEWDQLGFIYTDDDSLVKYEGLLSKFRGKLIVRRLNTAGLTPKYTIKYFMTTRSQNRFVVDIPRSEIEEFLNLIDEYNMTDQYYSYIFTDWDTQFTDPKAFSVDKGANFSALSLLPLLGLNYQTLPEESLGDSRAVSFLEGQEEHHSGARDSLTYYFLLLDTLNLLAFGISRLANATDLQPPVGLSCDSAEGWTLGSALLTEIKSVKGEDFRGSTGYVEFTADGRRKNTNITILEMNKEGVLDYGYWNAKDKLVVTKEFSTTKAEIQKELKGQVLRVTTIEEIPFVMYKGPSGDVKSIDPKDWHGFCIDLLNECASALEFNYTVHPVTDGNYGTATKVNGQEVWDGIIGQLQFRKADLAVAMLTISYERERVIDFTTPFMNLGISIIFKKPDEKKPELFSFLRPLSPAVWGYVLIAYVGVSMTLFFVARFSPYEWNNPHPCNTESELLKNNFNMLNSLWFTIGSLMQQGSDILPRATSTRIIAGFWWFFTLIIISSYTANLAAFLTVERMKVPIEDVNDLAKQTQIKYGTRRGGSSAAFFSKSNQSIYQRMWQFMSTNKGVMINNATEAIARVKRGGYAYILESTMNEYFTQRNCDLIQIGDNLDSKGYGIGFPQGSKYRDAFTEVILQLQASQRLEQIRRYWWRNYNITIPCSEKQTKSKDTSSLGLEQVGGCFVMILIGLAASVLISLQEFLYKVYHRANLTKRPFSEEMAREFRFSMARSSTRDFGAESALTLPPPPSTCVLSKECRVAALAYAPCLPAVVKPLPSNGDRGRVEGAAVDNRRPSALDVARMHRRASCRRYSHVPSHSTQSGSQNRVRGVSQKAEVNSVSDSSRALIPPDGLPGSGFLLSDSIQLNGLGQGHRVPQTPITPQTQPPDLYRQPQAYNPPPPMAPPIGFITTRMSSRDTDSSLPYHLGPSNVGGHGDIRVQKFTC